MTDEKHNPQANFSLKIFEAGAEIRGVPKGMTQEEAQIEGHFPKGSDYIGSPLINEDDIGPGDLVLIQNMLGCYSVMKVCLNEEDGQLYASNEIFVAPLCFAEDERHSWTSPGMFNVKALQALEDSCGE